MGRHFFRDLGDLFIGCLLPALLVTGLLCLPQIAQAQNPPFSSEGIAAQDGEAVKQARAILDQDFQTELPRFEEREVLEIRAPHVLPDIFSQIAVVLGVILILIILFNIFYGGGHFASAGDDGSLAAGEDIDFSRLQVPDPELLAAQGRFAEAIHAVLLRSLVLISRRLGLAWPRSLTSREILRQGRLPTEARDQLGKLIHRVELHHFGGMPPAVSDYQRCHEIYDRLAHSLKGGES